MSQPALFPAFVLQGMCIIIFFAKLMLGMLHLHLPPPFYKKETDNFVYSVSQGKAGKSFILHFFLFLDLSNEKIFKKIE